MISTISYDDDDDYKDARNRAKPSLGEGVGGGGNEVPAGFVHNPQQELRRVEKARRPIIIRRGGGPKIRRTARRRSQSPLSPWLRAFWPTGTMLPVHSLPLTTTCAASWSSPECPHTGSEFGQQPSQPYTMSQLHFKTPNPIKIKNWQI